VSTLRYCPGHRNLTVTETKRTEGIQLNWIDHSQRTQDEKYIKPVFSLLQMSNYEVWQACWAGIFIIYIDIYIKIRETKRNLGKTCEKYLITSQGMALTLHLSQLSICLGDKWEFKNFAQEISVP
jgi:hypothetical protein